LSVRTGKFSVSSRDYSFTLN